MSAERNTAAALEEPVAAAAEEEVVVGVIVPHVTPPVTVRGFDYYMDGTLSGRLFLQKPCQRVSWRSKSYVNGEWNIFPTPWHGEWHTFPSGTTVCLFDFGGRETQESMWPFP